MFKPLVPMILFACCAFPGDIDYNTKVPASDVIKIDAQGNVYAAGIVQGLPPAGHNIAVTKLDPAGNIVFSTFLGGTQATLNALALDSSGNVYLAGAISSDSLTVTPGVLQGQLKAGTCLRDGYVTSTGSTPVSTAPCSDAFVAEFDNTGKLVFSTYLGGSADDSATALAIDSSGFVYVTGTTASDDFPVLSAFQSKRVATTCTFPVTQAQYPCWDSFVARISPGGSAVAYSTYIGGIGNDTARGIALDAIGNVYFAGQGSPGFPITQGVFHDSCSSRKTGTFAFVTKLNPATNTLAYSGCVGTSDNPRPTSAIAIAIDASNQAHVSGYTESDDFAISAGAFQPKRAGFQDLFVLKISGDGSRVLYSTYLGGTGDDFPTGLSLDSQGRAVVGGRTSSTDFPIRGAGLPPCSGHGFVAILTADGTDAVLSGYSANDIAFDASPNDSIAGASLVSVQKLTNADRITRPVLPQYCAVGSADFIGYPASVTPGEVMTLFGRGLGLASPTTLQLDSSGRAASLLAGTRVLFDGVAAPLMYVQDRQINVIAPYSLAGAKSTKIQVEFQGGTSVPLTIPVTDLNPSVFRTFPTLFPAFILADGTLNSPENPVAGGSVIGFYTTGAGQTIPPSVDGQIASQPPPAVAGPVSALIQGVPADIVYAGTIPGLVTAVQQFQLRVPSVPNPGIARLQLVLGSTPYDIGNIWVRLP